MIENVRYTIAIFSHSTTLSQQPTNEPNQYRRAIKAKPTAAILSSLQGLTLRFLRATGGTDWALRAERFLKKNDGDRIDIIRKAFRATRVGFEIESSVP